MTYNIPHKPSTSNFNYITQELNKLKESVNWLKSQIKSIQDPKRIYYKCILLYVDGNKNPKCSETFFMESVFDPTIEPHSKELQEKLKQLNIKAATLHVYSKYGYVYVYRVFSDKKPEFQFSCNVESDKFNEPQDYIRCDL